MAERSVVVVAIAASAVIHRSYALAFAVITSRAARCRKLTSRSPIAQLVEQATVTKNGGSLRRKLRSENRVNCGKPKARVRQGNPQPSPRDASGRFRD